MKRLILMILLSLAAHSAAQASMQVVATVPNIGMLAREIGGQQVRVRVLAPPDRDAHYLEARPSMMAALRRADLLVAVGAELEIGWLPAAIRGANNPRIHPGRTGYFESAAHVDLIEVGGAADRARGDVHPAGNPHLYMDPVRMAEVGRVLAERMAALDSDNAGYYRENAERFASRVRERVPDWKERAEAAEGALAYHGDANYLLRLLEVPLYGHIEVLPGIPPTASHLRDLVRRLQGREGVIFHMDYQPSQGARFMERELGWPVFELPGQVGMNAGAEEYFEMIDRWVAALVGEDR